MWIFRVIHLPSKSKTPSKGELNGADSHQIALLVKGLPSQMDEAATPSLGQQLLVCKGFFFWMSLQTPYRCLLDVQNPIYTPQEGLLGRSSVWSWLDPESLRERCPVLLLSERNTTNSTWLFSIKGPLHWV